MQEADNLKRAREILLKLNEYVFDDSHLRERFIESEYNWLQFYQALIFLDIREYLRAKPPKRRQSLSKSVYTVLTSISVLLVSFIMFLFLIIFRQKVLVFSTDKVSSKEGGDFRIGAVYQFLNGHKIPFVEVFYTTLDKRFFRNLQKRSRLALYLQAVDMFPAVLVRLGFLHEQDNTEIEELDLHAFGKEEDFIRALLYKYNKKMVRSKFSINAIAGFLRLTNVQMLFTIDSVRRYNELVAACKKAGVDVIAFQHGQFTKYQVGWFACSERVDNVVRPNVLVVWNKYWKKELEHFNTYFKKDEMLIGGKSHTQKKQTDGSKDGEDSESSVVRVLVPFETDVPKKKVGAYISRMTECDKMEVLFKVRPDVESVKQLKEYALEDNHNIKVVMDMDEALANTDVVAGAQSTLLYEMVEAGKPVLIFDVGFDYTERMIENGLADLLSLGDDVCEVVRNASNLGDEEKTKRQHILVGDSPVAIEDTLKQLISKLI